LWDHPVPERQQKLCGDIDFSDGLLADSGFPAGHLMLAIEGYQSFVARLLF